MVTEVDERARLQAVAEDYWAQLLRDDPILATSIGHREYDALLPDVSVAAVEDRRRRLAELRGRATAVDAVALDAAALDAVDAVTRAELIGSIDREDEVLALDLPAWSVDPLEGPPLTALNLEAIQPVRTPDEGDALAERWEALGGWLDANAAELRRGLEDGRVAARAVVAKLIDVLDAAAETPAEELPLLAPTRVPHDDWPAGRLDRYRAAVTDAVQNAVLPAFRRYREVLATEVLPLSRPDEAVGIAHLPGGEAAYRTLVRYHTTIDREPRAIHDIGLAEVARIDAEMAELGRNILGATDRHDTIARLRGDPALHFSTRDQIEATAEDALARAQAAVPDWFGRLPATPCVVVRMGAHEEPYSTIAYYREPAIDGSRPGQYYVNSSEPATRPRYEAEALAFHESVPGHHLQVALAQELTDLPAFRRHLGSTAFVEGWGLYSERLASEMGLYTGDLDRFGILSFDAWRACRLVVDTGMHALGWTRQQAIDFMVDHTALGRNNIENEVDRYILWPGQALAYKTGQLEMLRLRAAAESALGDRFDVRGFHDVLLGSGAVSLETLARIVTRWTEDRAAGS